MLEDKKQNIIYFDSDDEFYDYIVNPEMIICQTQRTDKYGNPVYYADWDFTKAYYDALQNKTVFIIKNEDSQIYKRGAVSYRTSTKPVQNLEQYICED